MSNPLTIDNVTFTWSEEHGHWRAGELVLQHYPSRNAWEAHCAGMGFNSHGAERVVYVAREHDPLFAAEFTRLQQSQQRIRPTHPSSRGMARLVRWRISVAERQ